MGSAEKREHRFPDPASSSEQLRRDFCSASSPLRRGTLQNAVTPFHQSSLSVEVCFHHVEALMILCSRGYLWRIYMKPSFAECGKSQTVNVPLLNVPCSLFPPSSVHLGELLFPLKFGCFVFFLEVSVASALLALHHFITIFPKQSFYPSINEGPPTQYLKDALTFVPVKCICALSSQLSLYVAWI